MHVPIIYVNEKPEQPMDYDQLLAILETSMTDFEPNEIHYFCDNFALDLEASDESIKEVFTHYDYIDYVNETEHTFVFKVDQQKLKAHILNQLQNQHDELGKQIKNLEENDQFPNYNPSIRTPEAQVVTIDPEDHYMFVDEWESFVDEHNYENQFEFHVCKYFMGDMHW